MSLPSSTVRLLQGYALAAGSAMAKHPNDHTLAPAIQALIWWILDLDGWWESHEIGAREGLRA